MKLIQIAKSCDLFFLDSGLLGEMGEGCCTHFSFFIPIGVLWTSVKFRELIPGKIFHLSFRLVRVFCTVHPGSHLLSFHFLHTLSLPNVCSTHTLPVSYGQLKGILRNLMRDHTHYDQSKWQLTVIVSDHPTGTHVTHWGIWPSTQVTHFHPHHYQYTTTTLTSKSILVRHSSSMLLCIVSL